MTELECLGAKHGTDKVGHKYLPHYEQLLGDMRLLPITMIEIGVMDGASLRMWKEWMPRARIYGLDIKDYEQQAEQRIEVIKGDQGKQFDLENLVKQTGRFHFVVDDGGHNLEEQKVSYNYLWPRLLSGGWYVVEDLNGFESTLDLGAIVRNDNDITEFHLVSSGHGSGILFLKKR